MRDASTRLFGLLSLVAASASSACGDDVASSEGTGGAASVSSTTALASATSTSGSAGEGGSTPVYVPGLRAEYFDGYDDGAVLARVEPGIDHDWGADSPGDGVGADHFSARWTGMITASTTATYTLAVETDDGVRLWIGDRLVIDDWKGQLVTRNEATVTLSAGVPTPIRFEYFELDLDASARLLWSSPVLAEQVVPADHLETVDAPTGLSAPKPPYQNPVVAFDCPDPGVIALPTASPPSYDVVCTGGRFPIRTSRNLVSWSETGKKVLPDSKPPWAANGNRNWAPEIHQVGDAFVAYFTSVNGSNVLSVGAAHASSVLGPYEVTDAPLVQRAAGVIDPTFFEDDDGSRWLFYKIDGNAAGHPTPIFVRRLSDDGLSFAPDAEQQVLVNEPSTWEGGVVEAPWVVKRNGTYYLFYSGNVYDHRYRTGVARSSQLLGPYEKHGAPNPRKQRALGRPRTWLRRARG